MTHVADAFHANDKKLILVVPPKKDQGGQTRFTPDHFEKLRSVVDYFSLMTYDYFGSIGAFNAPLPWVKNAVEYIDPDATARAKILTGLNFYGRYIPNIKAQGIWKLLKIFWIIFSWLSY